ncbi:MAG: aspartate aminotransferase family protein, partial [Pseudomonadota bacterium]
RHVAEAVADGICNMPWLELLLGPQLTVLLFKPREMSEDAMAVWAETHRRSGALLCLPTSWQGETVFRMCFVNQATDPNEVLSVLETLKP